jgi:hypothetical protein
LRVRNSRNEKGQTATPPCPPREGRRDLRGGHGGVGTGDENPDVLELVEAVEPPLPAGNPLDLVEEEIPPPPGIFEFDEGFVKGCEVLDGEGRETFVVEIQVEDVGRDDVTPRQEVPADQPQEG